MRWAIMIGVFGAMQAAQAAPRNLEEFAGRGRDAAVALTAACAGTAGPLRVYVPGHWRWGSTVSACGGRDIAIEGDGPGVSVITASAPGVMLDVAAKVGHRVTLRGLTVVSEAPEGTRAVLRVRYPAVPSSSRGSVVVEDVEIASPASGAVAGSICTGVMLVGAWHASIERVVMTGRVATPGESGCALVDLAESFAVSVAHSQIYYGDALVFQSGYAEGTTLVDVAAVGTNYLYRQGPDAGIVRRGGMTMVGLWATHSEASTQLGGVQLREATGAQLTGVDWAPWGPGSGWIGYDLVDVQNVTATGDLFVGGADAAGVTAIRVRAAGGAAAASNSWVAPTFEGAVGVGVDFGEDTSLNAVMAARLGLDRTRIINRGRGNHISFRTGAGAMAVEGNADLAGSSGQVLLGVSNVAGAVNHVRIVPGAAGIPPVIACEGPEASVGCVVRTQGVSGFAVVSDRGGTLSVIQAGDAGLQTRYPMQRSASGEGAAVYTANAGTNVAVLPGAGAALLLSGIPLCARASAGQLCRAGGSGSGVFVK